MPRVFEKRPRLAAATPELDELERRWWDEHAELVERLWTLPPDVRTAVRAPLAAAIRGFFGSGVVAELGCGSGWLGRMIAGRDLRVIGIDFSREQIRLAKREAHREGLDDVCEYRIGDFVEALDEEWSNILVHASLHHLADDEFARALDRVAARPNRRVFLYEPVFPEPLPLPRLVQAALRRLLRLWLGRSWPGDRPEGADTVALDHLEAVSDASNTAGWFFSPKEVPFEERRLKAELRARFRRTRMTPFHFWSLQVAQRIALVDDPVRRALLTRRLLRRALRQDRLLFTTRLYRVFDREYVFYTLELDT